VREHTLGSTEAYLDVLGLGRGSRTRVLLRTCSDSPRSTDSLDLHGACGAWGLQLRKNELQLALLRSCYALELKRSAPLHSPSAPGVQLRSWRGSEQILVLAYFIPHRGS
jgi:hypothetical protein